MSTPRFTVTCTGKKVIARKVYEVTLSKPEGFTFRPGLDVVRGAQIALYIRLLAGCFPCLWKALQGSKSGPGRPLGSSAYCNSGGWRETVLEAAGAPGGLSGRPEPACGQS